MPTPKDPWPKFDGPPPGYFELNRESPQMRGLVAWWPTLGSRGTNTLRDYARGSNGVLGATAGWAQSAQKGGVLEVNALATDGVNVANNASISTGDIDFLVAFWAYSTVWGNLDIPLMKGLNAFGAAGIEYYFQVLVAGIRFGISDGVGLSFVQTAIPGVPANDVWYHIAAWHDASASRLYIKINDFATVNAVAARNPQISTTGLGIGADQLGIQPFDGLISDVRLYKTLKTEGELYQMFTAPWDLYKTPMPLWAVIPGFVPPVVFPWVYPVHAVYDASEQHAAYDDSFQHADYDPSEQHAEYSYE